MSGAASPARHEAHRILVALEGPGPGLAERLAEGRVERLDVRERALLHELLLGSLRRRGRLDQALRPLLDRPLARLDAETLAALRLGAHQVLHLRIPDRAAVSESVALLRGAKGGGLVNAVLRRLCREGPPPAPDPVHEPEAWLATEGSLPEWLSRRWIRALGPEGAVARARALAEEPGTFFRFHPRRDGEARARAEGIEFETTPVPECLRLVAGRLNPLVEAGLVYVHDLGSQLVARLAIGPGRLLDACAAPGGKALLLADQTGHAVVAADVSLRRLDHLVRLARRWGAPLRCLAADARRPPFGAAFDAVLADVPCSGLGTLARHPDIRWRLREDDIPRQAARQRAILTATAAVTRPGARLVYATCSLEPEENDAVIRDFLAAHPEWHPEAPPAWAASFADGDLVRVLPERHGSDGFVAGVLRRG